MGLLRTTWDKGPCACLGHTAVNWLTCVVEVPLKLEAQSGAKVESRVRPRQALGREAGLAPIDGRTAWLLPGAATVSLGLEEKRDSL